MHHCHLPLLCPTQMTFASVSMHLFFFFKIIFLNRGPSHRIPKIPIIFLFKRRKCSLNLWPHAYLLSGFTMHYNGTCTSMPLWNEKKKQWFKAQALAFLYKACQVHINGMGHEALIYSSLFLSLQSSMAVVDCGIIVWWLFEAWNYDRKCWQAVFLR